MDVSVGYGPVLWGVDWGHNVWFKLIGAIKQQGQDGWTEVDKPDGVAKMVNIDVGRDGHVWGVDDVNKVYYRHGISPANVRGTHWAEIPQSDFTDVAVCTDGHVWAIGTDQKIYARTMIVDDDQVGQAWMVVEDRLCEGGNCMNTATQVTCGGGNVMVLGANNRVFRRTDVTNDNPYGNGWETPAGLDVDNMWMQVTAGENEQVWLLHTADKNVYRYTAGSYQAVQPGRFKQINCGNWMLVGVTAYNEVYMRDNYDESSPNGDDWKQMPGSMAFVSTAEEQIVWALDQSGSLWILDDGSISTQRIIRNEEEGWTKVEDGKLVQVDVGRNGHLIGRFTDGLTYFRTGINVDLPMGDGWMQVAAPGSNAVSTTMCATGDFLLLDEDKKLYMRTGVTDDNPTGVDWMLVDTVDATAVNCGYRGYFWVVRSNGLAAMRTGVTANMPQGDGWQDFGPQTFLDVAVGDVGDCDIWAVGSDNRVYQRIETSSTNAAGTGWQEAATTLGDAFIRISAGSKQVVAIDHHHNIWEKTAEDWVQVPGALRQASVGQRSVVWGVDEAHDLWFRQGGLITPADADCYDKWIQVDTDAKMVQLDVGMNGGVYAVTDDGKLFQRTQAAGQTHTDAQSFVDNTQWA
jgi:hypothetical protein